MALDNPPDLATQRKVGRPGTYTPERGALVCQRMIEVGDLAKACKADPRLPNRATVYDWCVAYPEFDSQFTRARERLMDRWADDLIEIADDDVLEPNDRRVKIETRKWLMSKLAWRRFGDKVQVGGDPENPLMVIHQQVTVEQLSPIELQAIEQLALARLNATDVGQSVGQDDETPQKP